MGGVGSGSCCRAIIALSMLLGFSGCTTQEGDVNTTIVLPAGDGGMSVPLGDCVPGTSRATGVGVGQCVLGSSICAPEGRWGHSIGEGSPRLEVCDGVDNDCDGQIDEGIDCLCSDEIEICDDRRDNNCNGAVDEGCSCDPGVTEPCITDLPGACALGTFRCRPDGVSFTECLPSAREFVETCDGLDNDCDGVADEDVCDCTAFSTRGCLTGLSGACSGGTQTCNAGGRGFGPCLPTTTESDEACGDGVDNDCDGTADEGCECTSGVSRPCVSPLPGECASGLQTCTASVWGHCIPELGASPESCDGLDNDCDGEADDDGVCSCTPGATRSCLSGEDGVCATGTQTCTAGGRGYTPCLPTTGPGSEVCDGLDNDCDGVADEEVCTCTPLSTRVCNSGMYGQCAAGLQTCSADGRGWGTCLPTTAPTPDTCGDGLDSDCDGRADEGCTCSAGASRSCLTGLFGECADGIMYCSADGRGFGPCQAFVLPWLASPDVCGDGIDNDCDGPADEGCDCTPGNVLPCVSTLPGRCSAGTRTCTVDGRMYGDCIPSSGSVSETCNGVDDDCDGVADEDVCDCTAFSTRGCVTGLGGVCAAGQQTCAATGRGWSPCLPAIGPSSDLCADGIDSDCDGTADEDCDCAPGASRACVTTLPGACSAGTQACTDGLEWSPCTPTTAPRTETCDGIDNDCDGTADEEVCACTSGATASCLTGLSGICAGGTMTCTSGGRGFTACLPLSAPDVEVCNGFDDDCDGVADEEVCDCTPLSTRACNSGRHGSCAAGSQTCAATGRGWSPCLPAIGPSSDLCADGIDSDCDGTADEDCTCTPGLSRGCLTGLSGACSGGSQTCDAGRRWTPCLPATTPAVEVCNGLDDDCDGAADDDGVCTCTVGASASCLTGLSGLCSAGLMTCTSGGRGFTACLPTIASTAETCNGIDDDCDGAADESVCACTPDALRACDTGIPGVCGAGSQTCDPSGFGWSPCLTAIVRSADGCGDGLDTDCDGDADEGCSCTPGVTRTCDTERLGVCANGTQTCDAGRAWSPCLPSAGPSSETCDGLDNDCDGVADEEVCSCTASTTRGCITTLPGVCAAGLQTCSADGRGWGTCLPTTAPTPDTCGDGLDSDCDGRADEGCTCSAGASRSCLTGQHGICSTGLQTCDAGRIWGPCLPTATPSSETCNGADDDCDGTADEEVCACAAGASAGCLTGLSGACSAGIMTCTAGGRGFTACLPTIASTAETCNGIDDDCDGAADEDGVCTCTSGVSEVCSTGLAGACGPGTYTCRSDGRGYSPCVGATGPASDVCDGVDNDCDGAADEDGVCTCTSGVSRGCSTGLPGVCSAGIQTCDGFGRSWSICLTAAVRSADVCDDGLDNDCDGTADEDCVCTSGAIRACTTGLDGACSAGSQTCDAGRSWSPCNPTAVVVPETCPGDGIDSDCDGTADEDCVCVPGASESCLTGLLGLCTMGSMTCRPDGRSFTACLPVAGPVSEIPTNGTDDDCNGVVDDVATCIPGTVINCATGLTSICARGERTCLPSGRGYGTCVLLTGGNPEVCGDAIDNNCNGQVNEGCACTPGSSLSCSTGMSGVCAAGTTTCLTDGTGYGPCAPISFGSAEACNGLDDDCNGVIDNGVCP